MSENPNPLNLDCWIEGDEIVCANGQRIPRYKWYPATMAMTDEAYYGDRHPLIVEMLRTLPPPGEKMSAAEMDRWLRAFEGVLRLLYCLHSPPHPIPRITRNNEG